MTCEPVNRQVCGSKISSYRANRAAEHSGERRDWAIRVASRSASACPSAWPGGWKSSGPCDRAR